MPTTNWDNAIPQEKSSYERIVTPLGAHNAYMVGFTEAWTSHDNCYDCKGNVPNPDCKKCKGKGSTDTENIGIKYEMPDGNIEQERVTFKISPPRVINGQAIRSSKLYDRLVEFTKESGNDPTHEETAWGAGQLAGWAKDHQGGAHVPVLVIIKQPGKYPKITEVLYRQERKAAPTAAEVAAHRQPPRNTQLGQQRTIDEIAQRAKQNAEQNPFDDDPVPF